MKEEGRDFIETGFKVPQNGWHLVEFQEGIDYLPGKGGEGIYQNEKGYKTYKLPAIVKDENDPDDGADISQLVGMEKGGGWMANILACVGLWEAVKQKFPGPDVSVFDQPVMDGIKSRLPGRTLMMLTELDKEGRPKVRKMCSLAKYKEYQAEEKAKVAGSAKTAKSAKPAPAAAAPAPPADTPEDMW
jgi:hypothetical protein